MNLIPGLALRVTAEEEELGLDEAQIGEFAYDYVELRREFSDVLMGEEGSQEGSGSVKGAGGVGQPVELAEKSKGIETV